MLKSLSEESPFRKRNLNPILVLSSEKTADISRKPCRNFPEKEPESNSCFILGKTYRCFKKDLLIFQEQSAVLFRKRSLNPILILSSEKPADVSRKIC